ncbi:TolC family protein [Pedobacter sp. PLR]|uniref:TolC family protein n=1 Tax=Pedobacter sp. PLR TaxID=2994465 RepID=UPI002246F6F9|nr:TolC family protein [Pedobacter sp. PLR]MCX2452748.1 TolC family protein [Pedobacter sp. PLR]
MNIRFIALAVLCGVSTVSYAQTLQLPDALQRSIQNYEKIKAKEALVKASQENTNYQKSRYLPDFTVLAQQSFGTINAQNGPMYGYGGLGSAATSMPLAEQNWNAAFGSLYLANVNWNLFTFGRIKNQVQLARVEEKQAATDLEQEKFQHQVKVGAAYFNLFASQRIKYVQEKNLERAQVFMSTTVSRAASGLIPGVDASLAKAEVSNAQSARIKAYDMELEYSKTLSVLLGEEYQSFTLDSVFTGKTPQLSEYHGFSSVDSADKGGDNLFSLINHPLLLWQKSKISGSAQSEKIQRSQTMPSLSAFGVVQGRGSGFESNYVQDNSAYSKSYQKGVGIDRGNYLAGVTLTWNLTNLYRFGAKVKQQKHQTTALQNEYHLIHEELSAQAQLANAKLRNAVDNFEETKIQIQAASDAYRQNTTLYRNGLTTIVDLTQSLYALNRAEIDFEIARNNIWQALLLKSAAEGELSVLLNAIP